MVTENVQDTITKVLLNYKDNIEIPHLLDKLNSTMNIYFSESEEYITATSKKPSKYCYL